MCTATVLGRILVRFLKEQAPFLLLSGNVRFGRGGSDPPWGGDGEVRRGTIMVDFGLGLISKLYWNKLKL